MNLQTKNHDEFCQTDKYFEDEKFSDFWGWIRPENAIFSDFLPKFDAKRLVNG